jgi:hypothetical protein
MAATGAAATAAAAAAAAAPRPQFCAKRHRIRRGAVGVVVLGALSVRRRRIVQCSAAATAAATAAADGTAGNGPVVARENRVFQPHQVDIVERLDGRPCDTITPDALYERLLQPFRRRVEARDSVDEPLLALHRLPHAGESGQVFKVRQVHLEVAKRHRLEPPLRPPAQFRQRLEVSPEVV